MKTKSSQIWTVEQLIQLSDALGNGYMPGLKIENGGLDDRWTAQRHQQASALQGRAYS
ncbi:MAG: hypothetical protein WBB18_14380 [Nodosilinea sp.]